MAIEFRAIIFDLDGTLLDTLADIGNSMNAVLERLGFSAHPLDAYRYFVGDAMDSLVRRTLPGDQLDEEVVRKCHGLVKAEYGKRWAESTRPYPGIAELLDKVEGLGVSKAVLSNKPDEFTRLVVEKLLGRWSFEIVRGVSASVPKKPDPAGALEVAAELSVEPSEILYLGDTNTDMQTANAAGMYAVGAVWGFRDAEELLANGAKALAERPGDVLTILMGGL